VTRIFLRHSFSLFVRVSPSFSLPNSTTITIQTTIQKNYHKREKQQRNWTIIFAIIWLKLYREILYKQIHREHFQIVIFIENSHGIAKPSIVNCLVLESNKEVEPHTDTPILCRHCHGIPFTNNKQIKIELNPHEPCLTLDELLYQTQI